MAKKITNIADGKVIEEWTLEDDSVSEFLMTLGESTLTHVDDHDHEFGEWSPYVACPFSDVVLFQQCTFDGCLNFRLGGEFDNDIVVLDFMKFDECVHALEKLNKEYQVGMRNLRMEGKPRERMLEFHNDFYVEGLNKLTARVVPYCAIRDNDGSMCKHGYKVFENCPHKGCIRYVYARGEE